MLMVPYSRRFMSSKYAALLVMVGGRTQSNGAVIGWWNEREMITKVNEWDNKVFKVYNGNGKRHPQSGHVGPSN